MSSPLSQQRNYGLDILRVLACLMVIIAHSGECFYIGKFYSAGFDGIQWDMWRTDAFQTTLMGTLCRTSVPLFVMTSGFLLLPICETMTSWDFYRKRFTRVLIPLLVWITLYAFYQPFEAAGWSFSGYSFAVVWDNFWHSLISFPPVYGHLWYVYMLIGLYLLIPILSPWVARASRNEIRFFLGLWAASLLIPYLQLIQPEVLGLSYWNPNGTLYYFTGFIGFLIFGAYCKKYLMQTSRTQLRLMGIVLIITGYAWSATDMLTRIPQAESYCTPENYGMFFPWFEFCWNFSTIPVAMMTVGMFMLFFRLSLYPGRLVMSISRLSYGMYLMHIIFVAIYYPLFDQFALPVACKMLLIALSTYATCYVAALALSFLPKSKYVIG